MHKSNSIISPGRDENKKYLSCHHLVSILTTNKIPYGSWLTERQRKRNIRYLGSMKPFSEGEPGSLGIDISKSQKFKNRSFLQVSFTEALCYLHNNKTHPSAVFVMKSNLIFGTTFRKNPWCKPVRRFESVSFLSIPKTRGALHHSATILILSSTSLRVDGCWANSLPHNSRSMVSWFAPGATALKIV